jgi:hypothetical protein
MSNFGFSEISNPKSEMGGPLSIKAQKALKTRRFRGFLALLSVVSTLDLTPKNFRLNIENSVNKVNDIMCRQDIFIM